MRAPSLRGRLTMTLLLALVPLLAVAAAGAYAVVRSALYEALDEGLRARARTLAGSVENDLEDGFELEMDDRAAPEFLKGAASPAYYRIDLPGVVFRSESLGGGDLAGPEAEGCASQALPDGRPGRVCTVLLTPDMPRIRAAGRVRVAQSEEPVRDVLAALRAGLVGGGLVLVLVAGLVVVLGVRRGLRPLDDLARRIDAIDDVHLSRRLPTDRLPAELFPAVDRLNHLLARLEQSFARERRFSADVSHELRTPLAGLRTTLEVTRHRERTPEEYRAAVSRALRSVQDLERLVEQLLLLSRLESGREAPVLKDVVLSELVEGCLAPYRDLAERRRVRIENNVRAGAAVKTDPNLARILCSNLVSNAVAYTEEGGWIRVEGADHRFLEVADSGPPIPEEVCARLFDRFYRADAGRSAIGEHAGIGLSLAQAVATVLGLEIELTSDPESTRFVVRRGAYQPAPRTSPPATSPHGP